MHSYDGQVLLAGLEELCAHTARVGDECTIEAMGLSWLIMGISDTSGTSPSI
jgi:hypothetical protein